jgi:prepilin-type N-terminal cleavage/methylation domain-containing protein
MNDPGKRGKKKRQFNANKGFSLLELLIGLAILAIGILAITGMQMTSIRGNFFSDNLMQASILGQDRLEQLKSLHPFPGDGTNNELIEVRGTNFTRTSIVTSHPTLTGSWVIRVNVTWTDTSDHSVSFSTVRSP